MKLNIAGLFLFLSLQGLRAAEAPHSSLGFADHLTPAWISSAGRVDAGKRVIYYAGFCTRPIIPETDARLTISGDVLVIDGDSLTLASHVTCAQDGSGEITIRGSSKSIALDSIYPRMRARVRTLREPREAPHFAHPIFRTFPLELHPK